MKRERERDYNGKIKSLIPKHFLGFSGQFWWNTLFYCSYKLSKYSRKTIFQYPSYISWLSSISRIEKLFFFQIMCSIVWFRDYGTRLMSIAYSELEYVLSFCHELNILPGARIKESAPPWGPSSKGKQESGKENLYLSCRRKSSQSGSRVSLEIKRLRL